MDILSKKLDIAVSQGLIRPHPLCVDPAISHLSFADDVLIFFDGSEASLQGILQTIDEFHSASGLGINLLKSSLLLDGNNSSLTHSLAINYGLEHGSLPVRYLGLPLLPHKLRETDYQPLIEKVRNKLSCWKVKHLSFAGRLQLLRSVIYSVINFWATVFILPNGCLAEVEKLCNSFLWTGAPSVARGVKISWDSVCTSTKSGGLGLRRLVNWNQIFGLKLIWMLHSKKNSLWVSWVKRHLIGDRNFWEANFDNQGSWNWKRIVKLRELARSFIFCEPGDGKTCSFWLDNWTRLGPLISITGSDGPRFSGIGHYASLEEASHNGSWRISNSRSPILTLLRACLPSNSPIDSNSGNDQFFWCPDRENPVLNQTTTIFSSSKTWNSLHPPPPTVPWYTNAWFPNQIPKHGFISWVMFRNRLATRDRLRSWGLDVSPLCLLCNNDNETRNHIYFECPYSRELWDMTFGSNTIPSSSLDLNPQALSLSHCSPQIIFIRKLLYQALIYLLWKERNNRLHNSISRPAASIHKELDGLMRSKLVSLPAPQINGVPGDTYLNTWYSYPFRFGDPLRNSRTHPP